MTFLGTGHLFVAYYILWPFMYSGPEVMPDTPQMLTCAFCFWVYQTMDAMDGKQARRTGASSPLGQLFDHGCDAFALIVQITAVHVILGCGPSVHDRRWMFANQGVNQVIFFLAQWTEYHIHVLPTAVGPFGVTEMQYCVIFAYLIGGLLWRDGWVAAMQGNISEDIPIPFGSAFLIIHTVLAAISAVAIVLAVAFGADAEGDKVNAPKVPTATAPAPWPPFAIVLHTSDHASDLLWRHHRQSCSCSQLLPSVRFAGWCSRTKCTYYCPSTVLPPKRR